jgi:divalent metal cation (Fe/Co/Zn/Cd) transporter
MKNWKVFLFAGILILSIIIVFSEIAQPDREKFIGGGEVILNLIGNLSVNIAIVIAVFFSGILVAFIWYLAFQIIDSIVDKHIHLTKIQKMVITFLVAILFSLMYTVLFRKSLAEPETWIQNIAKARYLDWQPWDGKFGYSPVLWSIYGFITFILGYMISPKIMEPMGSIVIILLSKLGITAITERVTANNNSSR